MTIRHLRFRRLPLILLAGLLLFLAWLWFKPIQAETLTSNPNPATNYAAALARIEAMQAQDGPEVNPLCHTQLLTHGQQTDKVIILLHGYTNCPQQFIMLGEQFLAQGYNVLIPRLPQHGLADRLATAQAQLTAEELVALGDEVVDIGQGLGRSVTVAGFSAGGVLTGWIAQNRSDVDRAVIMAPAFGLDLVPAGLTKPFTNLLLTLPNFFRWWDPALQADIPGPKHAYPRFASRGLGHILRLGQTVLQDAGQTKPAANSILVISNANEPAVNNQLIAGLVTRWQAGQANTLDTYQFEATLGLDHDFIDPAQPDPQTETLYPILLELMLSTP